MILRCGQHDRYRFSHSMIPKSELRLITLHDIYVAFHVNLRQCFFPQILVYEICTSHHGV